MAIPRRQFTKNAAALTLGMTAMSATKVLGANEQVRLGCIGVANRGRQVIDGFLGCPGVEIVAICDVDQKAMQKTHAKLDGKPEMVDDFRKILDRKDIDAVMIATPDHWHAIMTIDACNAGKDVYVEKPLSITIHEGRKMVEAVRRNNRVAQVGTHRRSGKLYQKAAEIGKSGVLGKVTLSRAYRVSNMAPKGIGRAQVSEAPKSLNWDMWVGPRPMRPYQDNITPYKFRWWQQYSSQIGNWGVHYFDTIRWVLGIEAPSAVTAIGGRYAVDDDRTVPDTAEVIFELPGAGLLTFGQYEATGVPILSNNAEIEVRGTEAMLRIGSEGQGFEVVPDRGGQFQSSKPRATAQKFDIQNKNALCTQLHAANFIDCVKTRQKPSADIEIGHRSTTFSHLANISLALGQRLEWDAEKERVTNCDAANELLHYDYRDPWKLG